MANQVEESLLLLSDARSSIVEAELKIKILKELKLIRQLALPGIISRVFVYGLVVVTQMFLGHISSVALAAFSLDQLAILRFVNAIMIGISNATETLCGQAFRLQQNHTMGIYLQKSWILNLSAVTICAPLFIFSKQILLAIGQDKSLAESAGAISLWLLAVSYSYALGFSIQMYLQSQMKNKIVAWLAAPCFLLHIALCFLLITKLNLGLNGAMISFLTTNWITIIGCLVYIFGGYCPGTWRGFDKLALSNLWRLLKLSGTNVLMLCLEMGYISIIVLLAGYLSEADIEISGFALCLNINIWEMMICKGFSALSSSRGSKELERGDYKAAKFAMIVIFSISLIIGIVSFIICITLHREIAYLYTNNDSVVETVSILSLQLSFAVLLNSIQSVLTGVAIGSGHRKKVALVNFVCFYIVGLPVGVCLGFLTDLKVKGIWFGLLSAAVLRIVLLGIMVLRCDWEEQVK